MRSWPVACPFLHLATQPGHESHPIDSREEKFPQSEKHHAPHTLLVVVGDRSAGGWASGGRHDGLPLSIE